MPDQEVTQLIGIATAAGTLALVVIGFWYCYETRKLRLQSQQQLNLLISDRKITFPRFVVVLCRKDDLLEEEYAEEVKYAQKIGKKFDFLSGIKKFSKSEIATDIQIVMFDAYKNCYFFSISSRHYIEDDDVVSFGISTEARTKTQAIKNLSQHYSVLEEQVIDFFDKAESWVMAVCKDLNGNIILSRRFWNLDDNKIENGKIDFSIISIYDRDSKPIDLTLAIASNLLRITVPFSFEGNKR
jgi:hypothetical protein